MPCSPNTNEHRISLSRLLFLLEFGVFGGSQIFLITMNYVLAAASAFVFYAFVKSQTSAVLNRQAVVALGVALAALLFLWGQKENLTWGFQSQFFLVNLLPLSGFYFLYKSADKPGLNTYYWAALLCGVLALGAMANGVLALPLLVVGTLLMRMSVTRTLIMSIAMIVFLGLFFWDYHSPQGHASFSETLLSDPVGMIVYTCVYLGNPIGSGSPPLSSVAMLCAVFGGALIILTLWKT